MADVRHDLVRTYLAELNAADFETVRKIVEDLRAEAIKLLGRTENVTTQVLFDLRYVGQEFTLPVPVTADQLTKGDRKAIRSAFDELHEQRYAHHATRRAGRDHQYPPGRARPSLEAGAPRLAKEGKLAPRETRPVVSTRAARWIVAVYDRLKLKPGDKFDGPALVSEYASTTVIHPGDKVVVANIRELIITVGQG